MDTISSVEVNDGQLIEYEIEATDEEYKELKNLLTEVQAHDLELADLFTFKHFNERFSDADRDETQRGLEQAFQMIFDLGTEDTKRKINEIRLADNDHSAF